MEPPFNTQPPQGRAYGEENINRVLFLHEYLDKNGNHLEVGDVVLTNRGLGHIASYVRPDEVMVEFSKVNDLSLSLRLFTRDMVKA